MSAAKAVLIAVWFSWLGASRLEAAEQRFVVAVGRNTGLPSEAMLKYGERDAAAFYQVFVEIGNVPKKNAFLSIAPTLKELEQTLEQLRVRVSDSRARSEDTTVLFYFSGHADMDNLHLGAELFSKRLLDEKLKTLDATVMLTIIDACQTAPSAVKGIRAGPDFEVNLAATRKPRGTVTIYSTELGDPAYESEKLGSGIFSHHLVSGLRGAADTDRDGRVTLLEAYGYTYGRTVLSSAKMSQGMQFPNYRIDLKGAEELVLTEPSASDALLVIEGERNTSYFVFEKRNGRLAVKVDTEDDRPISIAVPKGVLLVQKRNGSSVQAAEISIPYGGRSELASYEFENISYDTMLEKGATPELHPNQISSGYQFVLSRYSGSLLPRHDAFIGYARRIGKWSLDVEAAVGHAAYSSGNYRIDDVRTDVSLLFGPVIDLRRLSFTAALGPVGFLVAQRYRHEEASRLQTMNTDIDVDGRNRALGIGGKLMFTLTIPIYMSLDGTIACGAAASAAPMNGEIRSLIDVVGKIGLQFRM